MDRLFYDEVNRLTKIKYPEATLGAGRLEENFGYDLAGNLITKTDQAGCVTTSCYDTADRVTGTIDPAQKTTAYEYNARSQMTAVVDAISQRYEFVYDPLGRVTQNKKGTATHAIPTHDPPVICPYMLVGDLGSVSCRTSSPFSTCLLIKNRRSSRGVLR